MSRLTRLMVLALVAMLLLGVPARLVAQDEPSVYALQAEVIYPAVIRFSVVVSVPFGDVRSLSLTLRQGDRTLRSGPLNLDSILFSSAPYTQFRYDWPIDPAQPPVLFEPLAYQWEMTSAAGEAEAASEVTFDPGPTAWRQRGDLPLRFSLADEGLNVVAARQAIEPVYELMQAHTDLDPAFNWAILPRGAAFCTERPNEEGELERVVLSLTQDAFSCSEEAARRILTANGYRVLERRQPGLLSFQNELVDDMFGEFYAAFWGNSAVPGWFRAGLRQMYHVTPNPLALEQVRQAARTGTVMDAAALDAPAESHQSDALFDAQAYTLVMYLADRYGAEAPFELGIRTARQGFDAAYRALVDQPLDEVLSAWESWLFTGQAERAMTWTIYSPATPTPTPTRTPTATWTLPPTITQTPSVTPSPAVSPTSRVIQVASPLPTYTPETVIPPTPSNTPRPPGSLNQPPAVSDEPSGGGGGLCGASLPAMLLPLAIFVGAYRKKWL